MNLDRIPVLVACGQVINRSDAADGPSPIELIASAVEQAQLDVNNRSLLGDVSQLAVSGLTVDATGVSTPLSGTYSNVPKSLAQRLGINPAGQYYCNTGGNTPQALVNHFAEEIAQGRAGTVLLTGGEALHTMRKRFNHWTSLLRPKGKWRDRPGGKPQRFGDSRACGTAHEADYSLDLPANVYPLFESALRAHYGRSQTEHMQVIGKLFHRYSQVAATNPYAWFPKEQSVAELITPSAGNRIIGFPYTKLLNSMIYVNQAAAIFMTSAQRAKDLGIAPEQWVYLHGCADAHDHWNITDRINFHSSPALKRVGQEAMDMASKDISEIEFFDIYSCFPSAVQIACDELGIKHDDERWLTLTGGLPYFGGAGNNYSMHAIAEMMLRARANPQSFGLLNANGWFLTKHSVGIYSASPLSSHWSRKPLASYQAEILSQAGPDFTQSPVGKATIEAFTVLHERNKGANRGIIVARLENGQRCLAYSGSDSSTLQELMQGETIGRAGTISKERGKNLFHLN